MRRSTVAVALCAMALMYGLSAAAKADDLAAMLGIRTWEKSTVAYGPVIPTPMLQVNGTTITYAEAGFTRFPLPLNCGGVSCIVKLTPVIPALHFLNDGPPKGKLWVDHDGKSIPVLWKPGIGLYFEIDLAKESQGPGVFVVRGELEAGREYVLGSFTFIHGTLSAKNGKVALSTMVYMTMAPYVGPVTPEALYDWQMEQAGLQNNPATPDARGIIPVYGENGRRVRQKLLTEQLVDQRVATERSGMGQPVQPTAPAGPQPGAPAITPGTGGTIPLDPGKMEGDDHGRDRDADRDADRDRQPRRLSSRGERPDRDADLPVEAAGPRERRQPPAEDRPAEAMLFRLTPDYAELKLSIPCRLEVDFGPGYVDRYRNAIVDPESDQIVWSIRTYTDGLSRRRVDRAYRDNSGYLVFRWENNRALKVRVLYSAGGKDCVKVYTCNAEKGGAR